LRRVVGVTEDPVRIVGGDGDTPDEPRSTPVWVIVALVSAMVGAVWLLTNQGSAGDAPPARLALPDTTTSTTRATTTSTTAEPSSDDVPATTIAVPSTATTIPANPALIVGPESEGAAALAGDIAITTPSGWGEQGATVWILRTDGTIVGRTDLQYETGVHRYPLLFTAGRIVFMHGNSVFVLAHDLAGSPTEVASASFIVPGATPGLVWFLGTGTEPASGISSISLMDVVSGTVGDRFDPWDGVVGVADGLIVASDGPETLGRFAYWSPKSGLVSLDLPDPGRTTFEAASGDLAVAVSSDVVRVLNVVKGTTEAEFPIDFTEGTVRSACVSPDQARVVVVWSNGEAFVGDIGTGDIIAVTDASESTAPGVRSAVWTSAEQLAYVIDRGDEIALEALDIATERRFRIATLEGSINWLLAADAAMC
jgi:hypothetical protein